MRRICGIGIVVLLCAGPLGAQEAGIVDLTVLVTWDLGVRVGVNVRPWDHFGFGVDVGSTLFSLEGAFVLSGDAYVSLHAFPADNPVQLALLVGVPDWRVVFADPLAAEVSLGASGLVSYALDDRWDLFLRAGAGVPFFAEGGPLAYHPTNLPLGLWPDLGVGAHWSM